MPVTTLQPYYQNTFQSNEDSLFVPVRKEEKNLNNPTCLNTKLIKNNQSSPMQSAPGISSHQPQSSSHSSPPTRSSYRQLPEFSFAITFSSAEGCSTSQPCTSHAQVRTGTSMDSTRAPSWRTLLLLRQTFTGSFTKWVSRLL